MKSINNKTMTKNELTCAIMHEFYIGNLNECTPYGVRVEWSKTLHIEYICGYHISGVCVGLFNKKGQFDCEKKVTEKFPKEVLQQIFDELTK